jgi:hypothetical protein
VSAASPGLLALIDLFALRHDLDPDTVLRTWELSRVLQLMHAEAARSGGNFAWAHYFDPEPELLARFDSARENAEPDWHQLEPDFS